MEQLRRTQARIQGQVRRFNLQNMGRNRGIRRPGRQPPMHPRQPVAARPQLVRNQAEDPPTPEPMRRRPPPPDVAMVEAEDEMDMPGGEQQHRDDVQRHFQRLMDRVRREPEP